MKKILNLNEYYYDDYVYKRINSIQNLFKSSIDKPNNYMQNKIIHKNPLHYFYIHYLFLYVITTTIYNFSKIFYLSIV